MQPKPVLEWEASKGANLFVLDQYSRSLLDVSNLSLNHVLYCSFLFGTPWRIINPNFAHPHWVMHMLSPALVNHPQPFKLALGSRSCSDMITNQVYRANLLIMITFPQALHHSAYTSQGHWRLFYLV